MPLRYETQVFRREIYTIYNEQVDFALQYLIDKEIYSCSFIEVMGTEQRGSAKESTCDIEIADITSIKQVHVDGMAPWRILSYDIESVPHKVSEGKYSFSKANKHWFFNPYDGYVYTDLSINSGLIDVKLSWEEIKTAITVDHLIQFDNRIQDPSGFYTNNTTNAWEVSGNYTIDRSY